MAPSKGQVKTQRERSREPAGIPWTSGFVLSPNKWNHLYFQDSIQCMVFNFLFHLFRDFQWFYLWGGCQNLTFWILTGGFQPSLKQLWYRFIGEIQLSGVLLGLLSCLPAISGCSFVVYWSVIPRPSTISLKRFQGSEFISAHRDFMHHHASLSSL